MRLNTIILSVFLILTSCSTLPDACPASNRADINEINDSSYDTAVERLSGKVSGWLTANTENIDKKQEPLSCLIFNTGMKKGWERQLEQGFIEDLTAQMINENISIVRKDMATWDRATGQGADVNCQEALKKLSADFLLEFSLRKSLSANKYLEAQISILKNGSNTILFMAKEPFHLTTAVARQYHMKNRVQPPMGSAESPFADYREAVRDIAGKLCCIARNLMPEYDSMKIIIKRTENTPAQVALAFSEEVSGCGIEQAVVSDKWLSVAVSAGDQFEMSIYQQEYRQEFETANVVLALDAEPARNNTVFIRTQLFALNQIEIQKDKTLRQVNPGMALPYCVSHGYAKKTFRIAQKKFAQTAFKKPNHTAQAQALPDASLGKLRRYIRKQLGKEGIDPRIQNTVQVKGTIYTPDCRVDTHYQSPENLPFRRTCEAEYNIKLFLQGREILVSQGRTRTTGSDMNAAKEQIISNIGHNIYPLIRDTAFFMNQKIPLETLRLSLLELDENIWQFSKDMDAGKFLDLLEVELEGLGV